MTTNQIAFQNYLETARHNKATENLTNKDIDTKLQMSNSMIKSQQTNSKREFLGNMIRTAVSTVSGLASTFLK